MQRTYEATIRLQGRGTEKVTVQASDLSKAKALIEAQYGKGCIASGPTQK